MLRVYDKCNLHIEASNVIVRPREIKSIHLQTLLWNRKL